MLRLPLIVCVLGWSVLTMLFLPVQVSAQISVTPQKLNNCIRVEKNVCIPTNVGEFVQQYYVYGLSFIGGLAILFIMYGGYTILTSRGNPTQLNNGKALIGYALIGLILAIFGYLFTEIITVDVLHIPGFG